MSFDSFKKELQKEASKIEGISLYSKEPEFFIDTGNYCINKIISGSYLNGFAQGRLAAITGPSGAGKSFLTGNAIKAAQQSDCGIFIIDTENALDDGYLKALGVDVDDNRFLYRGVKTIAQISEQFSMFTKLYRKNNLTDRFLLVIDSLDMALTDSELKNYEKGEQKGDQGQQAKQLKKLLQTIVQDIKSLPFVGLATKQAYKEQDPIAALSMPYVVTEATKFAFSQMIMVNKLMLKSEDKSKYEGITLQAMGYKTRFTKPFQKAKIEVPYDTGMDPFTGMIEAAESVGVLERSGSWYNFNGNKFQRSNFDTYKNEVLKKMIEMDDKVIDVDIDQKDFDRSGDGISRAEKIRSEMADDE